MKKVFFTLTLLGILIATSVFAEDLTITTYYPAPYGVYEQLVTKTFGVGDNLNDNKIDSKDAPSPDPADNQEGDVWMSGRLGINILDQAGGTFNTTDSIKIFANRYLGPTFIKVRGAEDGPLGWAGLTDLDYSGISLVSGEGAYGLAGDHEWMITHRRGTSPAYLDKNKLMFHYTPNNGVNWYTRMTIDTAGNVGIGTTAPEAKLHLSGDSDIVQAIIQANATQTNAHPLLQFRDSSGSPIMAVHSDSDNNVFVGVSAGSSNIPTGGDNGHYNTFVGSEAGHFNSNGHTNTACGRMALHFNTDGTGNTAIGAGTLLHNTIGTTNTATGVNALNSNTTGGYNSALGMGALLDNTTGSNNTAIGYWAGLNNNGSGNVFIGYKSGLNASGASNQLYIANAGGVPLIYGDFSSDRVGINTATPAASLDVNGTAMFTTGGSGGPLTIGTPQGQTGICIGQTHRADIRFNDNYLLIGARVNTSPPDIVDSIIIHPYDVGGAKVGIGSDPGSSSPYKLDVAGSVHATSFPSSSDARFKSNVHQLVGVLDKLRMVRGVSFEWNELYNSLGRSTGRKELGLIAQEIEKVFPELVTRWGDEDYRAVDYGRFTAVLLEAIKEQQSEIESLKKDIAEIKAR